MDAPPIDSADWAQQRAQRRAALRRREWVALAIFLTLSLLAWVNIKRVEVSGISMEPTFDNGDIAIVWKSVPRPNLRPGDIIVFRSADGDELIKRIVFIANPAAPIQFPPVGFPPVIRTVAGKTLYNADAFDPYFSRVNSGVQAAPPHENTIYVMGDNVWHSNDSRDFGPISPKQLLGKVIY